MLLDNLGELELIYEEGGIKLYRIHKNIGLLTINVQATFNSGTLISNMYKYYWSGISFNKTMNIEKLREYINLYQGILLYGNNSSHHFYCVMCVSGILQNTGNSTWNLASTQLVYIYK